MSPLIVVPPPMSRPGRLRRLWRFLREMVEELGRFEVRPPWT
jgi:hypothetical protein